MSKKESKKEKVFSQAIADMKKHKLSVFGPMSFLSYCKQNGLDSDPKLKTAPTISIQSIENLPKLLQNENVMILRLGQSERDINTQSETNTNTQSKTNTNTQFVLVKTQNFKTFFIEDKKINEEVYIPLDDYRESLLFYKITHSLMPSFSETSLVSLAIDSGLLSKALNLDSQRPLPKAVKIHSTFEFKIRLHSSIEKVCNHRNGQVEIDGMFFGYRDGKEILFVLEAKAGKSRSLAKHKLVYSVLSVFKHIPVEIPIIPVYLKIARHDEKFSYNIVECKLPDPRNKTEPKNQTDTENQDETVPVAIDELEEVNHTHLSFAKEHLKIN